MYFGRNEYDSEAVGEAQTRLQSFQGASSISSNQYFGRDEEEGPNDPGNTEGLLGDGSLAGLESAARDAYTKLLANPDVQSVGDSIRTGALKVCVTYLTFPDSSGGLLTYSVVIRLSRHNVRAMSTKNWISSDGVAIRVPLIFFLTFGVCLIWCPSDIHPLLVAFPGHAPFLLSLSFEGQGLMKYHYHILAIDVFQPYEPSFISRELSSFIITRGLVTLLWSTVCIPMVSSVCVNYTSGVLSIHYFPLIVSPYPAWLNVSNYIFSSLFTFAVDLPGNPIGNAYDYSIEITLQDFYGNVVLDASHLFVLSFNSSSRYLPRNRGSVL